MLFALTLLLFGFCSFCKYALSTGKNYIKILFFKKVKYRGKWRQKTEQGNKI